MTSFQTLILMAAGLSLACGAPEPQQLRALWQFRNVILCVLPDSWPIWDFADYGCYCGIGGSGTPVDDLDRCCQAHDKCYEDSTKLPACSSIFDYPYIKTYSYTCDKENQTLTCDSKNKECSMFVCECDRKAAECFSRSSYNPENNHLPSDRCK